MAAAATDVLIVGCGDVGERVAALENSTGRCVSGLVRSEASGQRLRAAGIRPIIADLDVPASLRDLPVKNSLIYYCAPPPGRGTTDPRMEAFVSLLEDSGPPARGVAVRTPGVCGAWPRGVGR